MLPDPWHRPADYKHKRTPTTPRQLRRDWLTGLIREVHVASHGTDGYRRIHAELTMGIQVCSRTVSVLMTQAGIHGLPGLVRVKRLRGIVTAEDLVNRKFHRMRPDELWVTDITHHRTREGWVYCAAVLDAFSRRIVGWSIGSRQDSTLVVNALDVAIRNRRPEPGGIVYADHGTQFTSWVFGERIRSVGLLPSFGTVGDGLDNAMMESFWSSMQIELLNRRRWKTRVELANAIFEHPHRVRTILRERHHPGCWSVTEPGAQMVGQVTSLKPAADLGCSRCLGHHGHPSHSPGIAVARCERVDARPFAGKRRSGLQLPRHGTSGWGASRWRCR